MLFRSEYWVIHPYEATILIYKLNKQGKFIAGPLFTQGDFISTEILPGLSVSLDEVFED